MNDKDNNQTDCWAAPGLLRVLLAMVYDTVLVIGLVFFAFTIVYVPHAMITGATEIQYKHLYALYMLIVAVGFHLWFWTHGGQTLGMRAWRIRVLDLSGKPLSPGQAFRRYLAACLSLLAAGLGFLWMLIDSEKRSWHDRLSGTRLVLLKKRHP